MLSLNWGSDTLYIGDVEKLDCPVCESVQGYQTVVGYSYFGVMWIFNFVTKKEFFRVCIRCQNAWQVDADSLGELAKNDSIPFMKKYGIFVFIALMALIIFFAIVFRK
jgi:hypothetical protein